MRIATFLVQAGLLAVASALHVPHGWNATREPEAIRLDDVATPARLIARAEDPSEVAFRACKHSKNEENLFEVRSINFSPNPPQTGRNLNITVRGTLKEDAEEGTVMKVSVKAGLITLVKLYFDFCEGVGAACPVKAGDVAFSKEQWLDKMIPVWIDYRVKVEMFKKKHGQKMGCVDIPLKLSKPPKSEKQGR